MAPKGTKMQIQQFFGNDLSLTGFGAVTTSDGVELAEEAIIRRLLTNPGTYFWHPTYGAGIGRYVGMSLSPQVFDAIRNTILSQILLESTVASNPAPIITLMQIPGNFLQCSIVYYSAISNAQQSISFQVS